MKNIKRLKNGIISVKIGNKTEYFTESQYKSYLEGQKAIKRGENIIYFVIIIVFVILVLTGVISNDLN